MAKRLVSIICAETAAYIVSALMLVVLAFAAYKTGMNENVVTVGICVVYFISSMAAGLMAGVKSRTRIAVMGIMAGAVYYAVILLTSFILNKGIASDTRAILTGMALSVFGGFAGGFLAGNIKK